MVFVGVRPAVASDDEPGVGAVGDDAAFISRMTESMSNSCGESAVGVESGADADPKVRPSVMIVSVPSSSLSARSTIGTSKGSPDSLHKSSTST